MIRHILILLLVTQFLSCNPRNEKSEIEVITYDLVLLNEIQSNFDSTYIEYPKRDDFWSIEYFFVDSLYSNIIFRDSSANIVGIVKRLNGKNIYAAEFYPNGQLIGKISYSSPGILDGIAKYYYEDGRIRSKGEWEGFNKIGEWKNYNEDGTLQSIEQYVNGKLDSYEEF